MADIFKNFGNFGSIIPKISEVVGELGGWMNILGIGKRRSSAGRDTQEAGLKASFMGAGENDEALFWSAVALARENGWVSPDGLKNISTIFSKLNYEEKNRLYKIIGQDEQNVTIEMRSKTDAAEAPIQSPRRRTAANKDTADEKSAKADKEPVKKIERGNIRGAMTISLLAEMEPADAVTFLKNSGTLTGVTDDLEHFYGKLSEFFKDAEVGKRLNKKLRRAILAYLGAKTLKGAKAKVSAKELALADRQKLPWFPRDLNKREGLRITWAVLLTFTIGAFVYVFSH